MNHEQTALWQRIRDFEIDAADASKNYTTRLAKENGWTPVYAKRVIDEYKKFAFLAVAAGHGVTSSKAIDEAWHLHLLYTQNYWEQFCPLALGQPLHHHPSNGDPEQDMKFQNWYQNTLASYERLFNESPPADIWPRPNAERAPKRRWITFLGLFALTGCDKSVNPLEWPGPAFLPFFISLFLFVAGLAWMVRHQLRGPITGPPAEDWQLHPYEIAFLNGGPQLALVTAIARLTAAGRITVNRISGRIRVIDSTPLDGSVLDRALLRLADKPGGILPDKMREIGKPSLQQLEADLRRQQLWVDSHRAVQVQLIPFALSLIPLAIGVTKINIGIARDRPVGFLISLCLMAAITSFCFLVKPRRSRYGDQVLRTLQTGKTSLQGSTRRGAPVPELTLGLALFGFAELVKSEYEYFRNTLVVNNSIAGVGDGGSSSSCGGGGGCGGGGCGGCGS